MEIHDDTEALRKLLAQMDPDAGEVESVHKAELDAEASLTIMANPKLALKAMGGPVSEESAINITMKSRASRIASSLTGAARLRRIIIIVIHYRNCDSDIIIIAS